MLHPSADGSRLLTSRAGQPTRFSALPESKTLATREGPIERAALSPAGSALALLRADGSLEVFRRDGSVAGNYALPIPVAGIVALAVTEDGKHVAMMRSAGERGFSLELRALDAPGTAVATAMLAVMDHYTLRVHDADGWVVVHGSMTLGGVQRTWLLRRDGAVLRTIETIDRQPVDWLAPVLYGERIAMVEQQKLWLYEGKSRRDLCGATLRDQLLFVREANQLLRYRVDEWPEPDVGVYAFDLIDLTTGDVLKSATETIAATQLTALVDSEGRLQAFAPTEDGSQLHVKIDW